ncbi:MAG: PEP-CTERM sorting domain-containing protein [Verrucomicrobiota bacterium]
MKLTKVLSLIVALVAMNVTASAAVVVIQSLDIRSGGVFGHDGTLGTPALQQGGNGLVLIDGAAPTNANTTAGPLDVTIQYGGLDLDGDTTANDTVTFVLRYTSAGTVTAMNQGMHVGFGNLDGLNLSLLSVSGTTTDLGDTIVFDGFTEATVAKGFTGLATGSVDVTGFGESAQNAVVNTTNTGSFEFIQTAVTFAGPVSSVAFSNTVSSGGSMVLRNIDAQFSTVPEPSTFALIMAALAGFAFLRRRK